MLASDARWSRSMPARSWSTGMIDGGVGFDVDGELAPAVQGKVSARCVSRRRCSRRSWRAGYGSSARGCCRPRTIGPRERLVRRLLAHAGVWPWEWRAEHLEEWIEDLAIGPPRLHVSTLRSYQVSIRLFCEYLLDRRYPWVAICTGRLSAAPQQIVDRAQPDRSRRGVRGRPRPPPAIAR